MRTPNQDRRYVGQFTVDPRDQYVKSIAPWCKPGSPSRCLLGTVASAEVGQRVTFIVTEHAHRRGQHPKGVIRLTDGSWRWERPMKEEEARFASNFDLGKRNRKPLVVVLDTRDTSWLAVPKAVGGGPKTSANRNGTGNRPKKNGRERSLDAARKAIAERHRATLAG